MDRKYYIKENAPKKRCGSPPPPPKPPPARMFCEGDTKFCKKCGSGIKFDGFLWLRELGCRQPECENYYGNKENKN